MALTDTGIRAAKPGPKVIKLSDGRGLQVWITPDGAKRWRLAYRHAGSQKVLAIGVYPKISLKEAREAAEEARKQLKGGTDLVHHRKTTRVTEKAAAADTFATFSALLIEKKRREGKSDATLRKVTWLLGVADEAFGSRPITAIGAPEILAALEKVEARGHHETAVRLRGVIGETFRFAMAKAKAAADPTVALRGALTVPVVKHRSAIIEPKRFGELLRSIDGYAGAPETRIALQLLASTFVRPGELRFAEWSEFDLNRSVWTVPEARTKQRRAHRVPLSVQTTALLCLLKTMTGDGKLLFPSVTSANRPMSENTINSALRRLGWRQDEMSAHGFRSAASSMLNESGLWNPDAIERQLAHVEANAVRRAYARADFWDERVRMMAWWSERLDAMREGETSTVTNVVSIAS